MSDLPEEHLTHKTKLTNLRLLLDDIESAYRIMNSNKRIQSKRLLRKRHVVEPYLLNTDTLGLLASELNKKHDQDFFNEDLRASRLADRGGWGGAYGKR